MTQEAEGGQWAAPAAAAASACGRSSPTGWRRGHHPHIGERIDRAPGEPVSIMNPSDIHHNPNRHTL